MCYFSIVDIISNRNKFMFSNCKLNRGIFIKKVLMQVKVWKWSYIKG